MFLFNRKYPLSKILCYWITDDCNYPDRNHSQYGNTCVVNGYDRHNSQHFILLFISHFVIAVFNDSDCYISDFTAVLVVDGFFKWCVLYFSHFRFSCNTTALQHNTMCGSLSLTENTSTRTTFTTMSPTTASTPTESAVRTGTSVSSTDTTGINILISMQFEKF